MLLHNVTGAEAADQSVAGYWETCRWGRNSSIHLFMSQELKNRAVSPREGERLAVPLLWAEMVFWKTRGLWISPGKREAGRNKTLASASQCRAIKQQVIENSCCPGSTYRPGWAEQQSGGQPHPDVLLGRSLLKCWVFSPPPSTAFCLFGLNHLAISFSLTQLPSCLFPSIFSHLFRNLLLLSSPLPSPHLKLSFLSFSDHSKPFLKSALLFSSLLTPAGTYAAFSVYTHVYTNSVSDKA